MNLTSTQFKPHRAPLYGQAEALKEGSTFGLEFDPLADVKNAISDTFETAGHFAKGACPGLGLKAHLRNSFFGVVEADASVGAVLNIAGTASGLVAVGQLAFGADPMIAAAVSATTLIGSGIINARNEG